ncbi:hypothetical protein LguiA_003177 [Lonicera macranthoides]
MRVKTRSVGDGGGHKNGRETRRHSQLISLFRLSLLFHSSNAPPVFVGQQVHFLDSGSELRKQQGFRKQRRNRIFTASKFETFNSNGKLSNLEKNPEENLNGSGGGSS